MTADLGEKARQLLEQQTRSWDFLRQNIEGLTRVQTRTFDFGRFVVHVQFNASRLASVSAKVDEESIRNRECFLCDQNRPIEQASLDCGEGFKLLCNPFPILPEHFTIVDVRHRPQRIVDCLPQMLTLAQEMEGRYTVFYNGPECGASAPDHLHLQAGTHGSMPIDADYDRIKHHVATHGPVGFFASQNYLRHFISMESRDRSALEQAFVEFHDRCHRFQPRAAEPLMNVLCSYASGCWRLIVFPRHKHRPSFYFANDHTRMLLSPGAVDMSGIVVMPVREQFERITGEHLREMYGQVTISAELMDKIAPFPQN